MLAASFSLLLAGCSDSPEAMLASAKEYLAKNDLNAASIQLKNVLQENNSLAEARFLLGRVNLQQGDVPGAVKELRRAAELGFPAGEVSPLLARALVRAADFDAVLAEFEGKTLESPAAQARLLAAVGDAHLAKANVDKARGAFEAAITANGDEVSAQLGLGRARLFGGDSDGALAAADAAVASDGSNAEAHALKADAHLARKELSEAQAELELALKADSKKVEYHFALISLLLREGKVDVAAQRLDAMKGVAADHPMTRYLQAFVSFRNGNAAEAREHIAETVRLAPNFLPGRLLAGSIYLQLKDQIQAQQNLGFVLARAPGQSLARRLMAQSLLASGESNRALETLQPLLDAGVKDGVTLTLAGQILLAKGEFERAAEFMARVVADDPDNAEARTRLGVSRMVAGDADRALADLQAASDLDEGGGQADVALVLAHLRRGELEKALVAQKDLERKQPDNPQSFNLKGGILLAKKDVAGARAVFERALEVQPDYLSAAINLARLDLADKKPEEARKRFERVIVANPKLVDAHLALADLLARSGARPEEVQVTLERAVTAVPESIAPRVSLVRLHLAANDIKKAVSIAQELAAANAHDPLVIDTLGRAQFAAGEHQQAIASFNKLASLLPQSPAPLLALADVLRATKDNAGAESALRKALAAKPDLVEAQQRLISIFVEGRRADEALAMAKTVQKQRTGSAIGFALEGDALAAAGKWDQAASSYRKVLGMQNSPEIVIKLHATQMQGGRKADADKTVAEWLRAQPKDLAMRGYLAERALSEQRYEDADVLYRKLDELAPDNPLVLNNLAWVAGQLKNPEAIAIAERAVTLAPDAPPILDTLGMLQLEAGQNEIGLENVRKAVTLSPDAPMLRLNLVKAYVKLGRRAEARKELDIVIGQAPAGSELRAEATKLKLSI